MNSEQLHCLIRQVLACYCCHRRRHLISIPESDRSQEQHEQYGHSYPPVLVNALYGVSI